MLTFSCNHLLQQGVFRQEVIRLMLLTAVSSLHHSTASNAAAFGTEESTKRRKEQKFKGKNTENPSVTISFCSKKVRFLHSLG